LGHDYAVGVGGMLARDLLLQHILENQRGVAFERIAVAAATGHDVMEEVALAHGNGAGEQDREHLDIAGAACWRRDLRRTSAPHLPVACVTILANAAVQPPHWYFKFAADSVGRELKVNRTV